MLAMLLSGYAYFLFPLHFQIEVHQAGFRTLGYLLMAALETALPEDDISSLVQLLARVSWPLSLAASAYFIL